MAADLASRLKRGPSNATSLFAVGQAGFILVNRAGHVLAWDLCLSDAVEKLEGHVGFKRLYPAPLAPGELKADVIVATHPHYDHFDPDAMPDMMASGTTRLFASPECRSLVRAGGIDESRVQYVKPGDRFEAAGFSLHFISCDHGTGAPDAVGILIETDGKRVLVIGDSCLRTDYVPEYAGDGPVDVMIAPINGAFGNLNERECCALTELVKPKLTVPSHFGLFVTHGGDPREYYRLMREEHPDDPFLFMCVGEEYILS